MPLFERRLLHFHAMFRLCSISFWVSEEHRDYLPFLWWEDGDTSKDPKDFRMTVHLFRATSSPSCANFGLKQIAKDHGSKFRPEASEFLRKDFYVDDGLKSLATEQRAIDLVEDTRKMCRLAGLHLHKFISTSEKVIASVPAEDRARDPCPPTPPIQGDLPSDPKSGAVDILDKNPTVERVLGVVWSVESDTLGFRILLQDQPLTLRGILSSIASVYDPLGLAAPVILAGKMILQELCRRQQDWDDPLDDDVKERWEH